MVMATLRNGKRTRVSVAEGTTAREVIQSLTKFTLTGSAAPLDDAWIELEGGGYVRFNEISQLEDVE